MNVRTALAPSAFLARTGLRAGTRDALAAAVLAGVTAFTIVLAPAWLERTAGDVLRARMATATEAQRGLEFELRGRLGDAGAAGDGSLATVAATGAELAAELPPVLRAAVGSPEALVDGLELLAINAPRPILRVTPRIQDIAGDAHYVEGRAPTGRTSSLELPDKLGRNGEPSWALVHEAALSTGTATEIGVGVGDRILAIPGANVAGFVALDVVGLFAVDDPSDGRWFADPTLATSIEERVSQEVTIYHAVALVAPAAYPALLGDVDARGAIALPMRYRWRFRVDPDRVPTGESDRLATEVARLQAAHPFGASLERPALSTGLADVVARFQRERAAATTAIGLAAVGPLAVMLGAMVLAAIGAARRRREAGRVVRARGGGVASLVAARAGESLVAAVPAAIVGGTLALALAGGRPEAGALVPAVSVGLVAVALAAAAAAVEARRPQAGRETGPGSTRQRRLVLDVFIVAVAIAGAVSLRGRDVAGDGAGDLDPFLAAVPVLLAVAGALLVGRLYPATVGLAARAAVGLRGLPLVHGLRGVARGAAGQQVPLVALLLAVAMGVLASVAVGTLALAEERAAAAAVGADLRIEASAGSTIDADRIAAVAGVEAVAVAVQAGGSLIGDGRITGPVRVVVLDVPAYQRVVAGLPFDPGLPPSLAATPPPDAGTTSSPVPAVVGTDTAERLRLRVGDVASLTVEGRTIAIRVDATWPPAAWLGAGGDLVLLDRAAARAALDAFDGAATLAFVRGPGSVAPAIADAGGGPDAGVEVAARAVVLAGLRDAPLVGAVRTAFAAAGLLALLYAMAVVAMATHQAVVARERELAVIRALGGAERTVAGLLLVEVIPLVLAAVASGAVLGVAISAITIPDLALERFVDLPGPLRPALDPAWAAALICVPLVGALVAIALGARGARAGDLAVATRAMEP